MTLKFTDSSRVYLGGNVNVPDTSVWSSPAITGFVSTRSNAQSTGIVLPLHSTYRHTEKPISVDFGQRSGQLGARNDRPVVAVGDGALGRAG